MDVCRRKSIEDGLRVVVPGSDGAELVDELKPDTLRLDFELLLKGEVVEVGKNEFVIYKPRWGAFYNTFLDDFLRKKNISTLVFTGCNFSNCPRTSIFGASERDFRIIAVKDAISGIYEKGINELENICVEVTTTTELLDKL